MALHATKLMTRTARTYTRANTCTNIVLLLHSTSGSTISNRTYIICTTESTITAVQNRRDNADNDLATPAASPHVGPFRGVGVDSRVVNRTSWANEGHLELKPAPLVQRIATWRHQVSRLLKRSMGRVIITALAPRSSPWRSVPPAGVEPAT